MLTIWSPLAGAQQICASQTTTGCLNVFILLHFIKAGHNVYHRCRPFPWLNDFIVIQLVGKPRNNILVTQLISHHKRPRFIHRRTVGNPPCHSVKHSKILLGGAGIRRLSYFGGRAGHSLGAPTFDGLTIVTVEWSSSNNEGASFESALTLPASIEASYVSSSSSTTLGASWFLRRNPRSAPFSTSYKATHAH